MELLEHNRKAYEAVKKEFCEGVQRTCVVHPTGTGKSYIALQLIEDNPDCSFLYVTSLSINLTTFMDKVREIVSNDGEGKAEVGKEGRKENKELEKRKIEFSLYSSLEKCFGCYDYIILDEFHRGGAQDWSKGLSLVLNDNPQARILGLSATPIRYLDSNRNMAEELFGGHISSEITLKDALVDKLLPMPHYKSAVYSFEEEFAKAEKLLKRRYDKKAEQLLSMAKQNLELAEGLDQFFRENLNNPHGKYIVFCRNIEHLESMIEEAKVWFAWVDDLHLYKVYAAMQSLKEYESFLADESDSLRLLFCVDMLNEGIHIDGIDGCIMLRPTESLNVYYQQLGRALTVSNSSNPEIFDIVHNSSNLEPVRHFWGGIREAYENINHESVVEFFSVFERDLQILQLLEAFEESIGDSWMYYYRLCEKYYKEHGDLNVPCTYLSEGHVLYNWINIQQHAKQKGTLSQDKIDLLELLNIDWNFKVDRSNWQNKFAALLEYKEKYGDLNVVRGYVTEDGFALGKWCKSVRNQYKVGELSQKKIDQFNEIGFEWSPINAEIPQRWMNSYKLFVKYTEETGQASVPSNYIYEGLNLGQWACHIRYQYSNRDNPNYKKKKLTETQIKLLDDAGFIFDIDAAFWEKNYNQAKQYYEENGTLAGAPNKDWISRQRSLYNGSKKGTITAEQIARLEELHIVWNRKEKYEDEWEENFQALKAYKQKHGSFPSEGDLHTWFSYQKFHRYRLNKEKIAKLDSIGMIWPVKHNDTEYATEKWEKSYEALRAYINENGTLPPPKHSLYMWCSAQRSKRKRTEQNRDKQNPFKLQSMLSDYQIEKLDAIGFDWKGADKV